YLTYAVSCRSTTLSYLSLSLCSSSLDLRHLHSFPTRRSSDLCLFVAAFFPTSPETFLAGPSGSFLRALRIVSPVDAHTLVKQSRSEEHTSELQSRENLVCRLLLEKKKNQHVDTDRQSNVSTPV